MVVGCFSTVDYQTVVRVWHSVVISGKHEKQTLKDGILGCGAEETIQIFCSINELRQITYFFTCDSS
jgi:hypothetical protein